MLLLTSCLCWKTFVPTQLHEAITCQHFVSVSLHTCLVAQDPGTQLQTQKKEVTLLTFALVTSSHEAVTQSKASLGRKSGIQMNWQPLYVAEERRVPSAPSPLSWLCSCIFFATIQKQLAQIRPMGRENRPTCCKTLSLTQPSHKVKEEVGKCVWKKGAAG